MFKFFHKQTYRVYLRNKIKIRHDGNGFVIMPDIEVQNWLIPYRGSYTIEYDSVTGERWVEFQDKQLAVLCKVALG